MGNRECLVCGSDVGNRRKYCSNECSRSPRFLGTYCENCNEELIVAPSNKSKKRFCSARCRYGSKYPNFKENYFATPDLENSYWAGFIAADGCILDSGRGQRRLVVLLKSTDKNHLEKLQSSIGAGEIYGNGYLDKRTGKTYYRDYYRVWSDKICYDLETNFKVGPRKSLTHQPPDLKGELALAFIAGYIDGDGCYWLDKGYPRIRIRGTKEVLSWIADQFDLTKSIWFDSGTYAIHFNGNDAIRVRDSFAHLNLPLLERKKNRWEELGLNLSLL